MNRRSLLFAFCASLFTASAGFARDDTPTTPPSEYARLFPVPTGTNGFEEFIRAGELVRDAKTPYGSGSEWTLTKKRAYLADPACQEALSLIREGLAKPIQLPEYDPLTTSLPFSLLRSLSRLLAVQVAVQFADGKNEGALQILRNNLQMASTVKGISVIGFLVGNSMDAIVMTWFTRFKEVWTPRDCEHIIALAGQQLNQPNPIVTAMEGERQINLRLLTNWRKDTKALTATINEFYASDDGEPETPEQRQAREYSQTLETDATVRERVLGELSGLIQEHYDKAFALLSDPTKRMQITAPGDNANRHPITGFMGEINLIEARSTVQRSIESRLSMQLLAVHAAIRRYRWEYDKLPSSLTDIDIAPAFRRDPFTGTALQYSTKADSATYLLASAGALQVGDDGKEYRQPYKFPYEAPKS